MSDVFERRVRIPAPAARVFAWHERPECLRDLIPPADPVRVLEAEGGIRNGGRVVLLVGVFPFRMKWVALHRDFEAGVQFRDEQVQGPFRRWVHTHTVIPDGPDVCWLVDHVEYELPFGPLARLAAGWLVRRKLESMFAWRHQTTLAGVAALGSQQPPLTG